MSVAELMQRDRIMPVIGVRRRKRQMRRDRSRGRWKRRRRRRKRRRRKRRKRKLEQEPPKKQNSARDRCSVQDWVGNKSLHSIILSHMLMFQFQSHRNNKPILSCSYVSGFLN